MRRAKRRSCIVKNLVVDGRILSEFSHSSAKRDIDLRLKSVLALQGCRLPPKTSHKEIVALLELLSEARTVVLSVCDDNAESCEIESNRNPRHSLALFSVSNVAKESLSRDCRAFVRVAKCVSYLLCHGLRARELFSVSCDSGAFKGMKRIIGDTSCGISLFANGFDVKHCHLVTRLLMDILKRFRGGVLPAEAAAALESAAETYLNEDFDLKIDTGIVISMESAMAMIPALPRTCLLCVALLCASMSESLSPACLNSLSEALQSHSTEKVSSKALAILISAVKHASKTDEGILGCDDRRLTAVTELAVHLRSSSDANASTATDLSKTLLCERNSGHVSLLPPHIHFVLCFVAMEVCDVLVREHVIRTVLKCLRAHRRRAILELCQSLMGK